MFKPFIKQYFVPLRPLSIFRPIDRTMKFSHTPYILIEASPSTDMGAQRSVFWFFKKLLPFWARKTPDYCDVGILLIPTLLIRHCHLIDQLIWKHDVVSFYFVNASFLFKRERALNITDYCDVGTCKTK